jgi:S-adenosylmethionine decarboxylase
MNTGETNPTMHPDSYGLHLTLEAVGFDDPHALNNHRAITSFLHDLVERVGMRILAGPLLDHEAETTEKYGWSGVVILYESHAAIHTYPHHAAAFLDIFSCRDFQIAPVMATLERHFGSHRVAEQALSERGQHWSPDLQGEMLSWHRRR